MKACTIKNFSKMRDDALSVRVSSIIEKMTDNPDFPTPSPSLAEVGMALDEYRHARVEAQYGGTDKTAVKKARRLELEVLLYRLAMYVQIQSKNDMAKLLGSGFDARKPWTRRPRVMLPPANFKLANGPHPGSMKLIVGRIPGAGSYAFECAPMPVTDKTKWEQVSLRSRTHTFQGLTMGQEYAFRVCGIGQSTTPVYSDVISRYTQ